MNEFLKFFDEKVRDFPMHMEIYYSKIMDWSIKIWKEGCKTDFPGAVCEGDDVIIVFAQDLDLELCFAQAHVALKSWLRDYMGGY